MPMLAGLHGLLRSFRQYVTMWLSEKMPMTVANPSRVAFQVGRACTCGVEYDNRE
jgi:hypothetical protein